LGDNYILSNIKALITKYKKQTLTNAFLIITAWKYVSAAKILLLT